MGKLMARTVAGFAFLIMIMAAALFIPAGSLRYWQAWVYLGVFALCTLLITVFLARNDRELLAGRVQAGPVAEPSRTQQIIQSLASLCFAGIFVVSGLDHRFGWSHVPAAVSLVAGALVALGFLVVFLVFRENSYTRGTVEVTAGQTVVTTGPYRFVRHPMYSGGILLIFATPVALGSWVAVLLAVPLTLVVVARLLDEEKLLRANLRGYEEYTQQVRFHLAPYIW